MFSRWTRTLLIVLFFMGLNNWAQAAPPYKVIAYLATGYNGTGSSPNPRPQLSPANIPWSSITSLYAFAAGVNNSGTVSYSPLSTYNNLSSIAHGHGVPLFLTVGGDSGSVPDSTWLSATSSGNLSTFVTNIINAVNIGGFDGVDIDWEFPAMADKSQYMGFMQALSTALRSQSDYQGNPMGLDFFIAAGYSVCGVDWPNIGLYTDRGIISGYSVGANISGVDFDAPINVPAGITTGKCDGGNQALSIAANVTHLVALGYSTSQMILGCPLYGGASGNPDIYSVILDMTPTPGPTYAPTEMESVYNDYPSGSADDSKAFCDKISWALAQGMPGIALFELSQACPAGDAPVTALWAAISNSSGCVSLPGATATPTVTNSPTPTYTPTATFTPTPCEVGGTPCTSTPSPTATWTPTITPTPTATQTPSVQKPVVFPNPTTGQPVSLQLPFTQTSDVKVQIFTVAYRKVWEQVYPQVAPQTPLSVSLNDQKGIQLANGVYYVVAITSQGTYKTKLLILR